MSKELLIGNSTIHTQEKSVQGSTELIDGEEYNVIRNVDQMDPFFMTIVSSSDHWMFISSNGGLTAGRKNAENALFPYYSDDKITFASDRVGSKTIIKILKNDRTLLWEPFSTQNLGYYSVTRNLYKNRFGSRIIFEEINEDLQLKFRYGWQFSEKFGFVKKAELFNEGEGQLEAEVVDGLQDLVPYGVSSLLQGLRSNLVNGYKRNVLEEESKMGIFSLSAMIVDRAEPSEALRATTVWSAGLDVEKILLSSNQLDKYRRGGNIQEENDIKGTAGSYFVHAGISVPRGGSIAWYLVAEINQDRAAVGGLVLELTSSNSNLIENLVADVSQTSEELAKLVAKADGLQQTDDKMSTGRHVSNVMFNIMRGGIFDENYDVHIDDFLNYLESINSEVYKSHREKFTSGDVISYTDLIDQVDQIGDLDLIRISYEYLPLTFSRRHGDPSRPWNQFNIDLKYADGSKKRSYEGNWRDIFQNWEALAYSYPEFTSGMISKFLNATTIDGYNPYRITRKGIDWEIIEPDDPWSYIGYWGDHQIIYLQKLLECLHRHNSPALDNWLNQDLFVYANVPYDIKSYEEIVANPQDTIDFNWEKQNATEEWFLKIGADGKMVIKDGKLLKATLIEKMLVTLLSKLSNFVPEGGIWLNTQRPEWNDANNALVGNGVSMVTLYYMRRFCHFFSSILTERTLSDIQVHTEVFDLLQAISGNLKSHEPQLSGEFSNTDRRRFVDSAGIAGSQYRSKAYAGFKGEKAKLSSSELVDFLQLAIEYIDHSIKANKREDGLYHSYNLLEFSGDELRIDHLYEMLEGQVAVLSSEMLSGQESLDVLDALKASKMFREDQYSYFLYPNRDIPHFLKKNQIPESFAKKSSLLNRLKEEDNTHLVTFDSSNRCYFNGEIHNVNDVISRLDTLDQHENLVSKERQEILDVFEEMFDHKSYTGRSGTFFSYEGLGSIYWHMVSKLLYAVQETLIRTSNDLSEEQTAELIQHYYEIRAGIGINKSPELYGAFPTDPYSHTPLHKGAQQPGMTGQVKEDVLNRWAELGVKVIDGVVSFSPSFLNKEEFLKKNSSFEYYKIDGSKSKLDMTSDQLAFTYCQVPIVYTLSSKNGIAVDINGQKVERDGLNLTSNESSQLFSRSGKIERIDVAIVL